MSTHAFQTFNASTYAINVGNRQRPAGIPTIKAPHRGECIVGGTVLDE